MVFLPIGSYAALQLKEPYGMCHKGKFKTNVFGQPIAGLVKTLANILTQGV